MTSATQGMVDRSSRQWGWVAAQGVLGILLGVVALFNPGPTIVAAAILLGIGLIVQGGIEVWIASRASRASGARGRGWLLAFGVLTLVAGLIVVFVPASGILLLAWGLILWFVLAGVHDLLVASSTREHRGWNIALGVLSIVVALVLLFSPGTAATTIALFIAFGFLFRGGAAVGLALSMRRAAG